MNRFLRECKVETPEEAYLKKLANSEFAYHLDDGAEACLEDKLMAAILDPKTDKCFELLGAEKTWSVYGDAYEKRHHE